MAVSYPDRPGVSRYFDISIRIAHHYKSARPHKCVFCDDSSFKKTSHVVHKCMHACGN